MAKPDDPPKPPSPNPENPLAGAPLDLVIEVLANASGQLKGLQGLDLKKHVNEVVQQVKRLSESIERKVNDEELRKEASAEVERLIDSFTRTGSAASKVIAQNRDAIAKQFQGVSLEKIAEGMRLFADWLQNPNPQSEAQVKALIEQLQVTMGPMVGYDPAREEEERRAQIKADVRKSLDEIFNKKK